MQILVIRHCKMQILVKRISAGQSNENDWKKKNNNEAVESSRCLFIISCCQRINVHLHQVSETVLNDWSLAA